MKRIGPDEDGFAPFQVIVIVVLVAILGIMSYIGGQTYLNSHPGGVKAKAKATQSTRPVCDRIEADRGCVINGFEVLAPNGGESICYGDLYKVKWKVPLGVESVTLTARQDSISGGTFKIAVVRASDGEFDWPVEDLDNGAYKVWLNSTYKGSSINDSSDRIFTVKDC